MDNINLATVIADTLIESDLISKHNFNDTVSLIDQKLAFHLGDDRGANLLQKNTTGEEVYDDGKTSRSRFQFENRSILDGTIKGSIYRKKIAVQTFEVDSNGRFTFANIGQPSDVTALSGEMDWKSGEMVLSWNTAPGENHIIVEYDYSVPDKKPVRRDN